MRLMTDCDVITHSIVKQTWHVTTKGEAAGKYTTISARILFIVLRIHYTYTGGHDFCCFNFEDDFGITLGR